MKRLEISGAVRLIYRSLGVKGLRNRASSFTDAPTVFNQAGNLALHTILFHSVIQFLFTPLLHSVTFANMCTQ